MSEEYAREPCPWRIADDIGGAFAMGAIGGGIFHFGSGFKNAPVGTKQRFYSAISNVKTRSAITGGQFAAWGGMFSLIDCSLVAMRKKEDPWNGIISGGLTGALLMVRSGPMVMATSGAIGAVLLAMIEGVGIVINRATAYQFDPTQPVEVADPSSLPEKSSGGGGGGGGMFGGMFGGGGEVNAASSTFSDSEPSSSSPFPSPLSSSTPQYQ